MNKHIKVLALLCLLSGAMGLIALLVMLVIFGVGGFMAAMDDLQAGFIIGILGMIVVMVSAFASIPNLIAGFGLLRYRDWARTLTLILCFIHLPALPIGTAAGAYGLWVLFNAEVTETFRRGSPIPVTSETAQTLG